MENVTIINEFCYTEARMFSPSPIMRPKAKQWAALVTVKLCSGSELRYWLIVDNPVHIHSLSWHDVQATSWCFQRKGYANNDYLFSDYVDKQKALAHLEIFPGSRTYVRDESNNCWVTLRGFKAGIPPTLPIPEVSNFAYLGGSLSYNPSKVMRMLITLDMSEIKTCMVSPQTKRWERIFKN